MPASDTVDSNPLVISPITLWSKLRLTDADTVHLLPTLSTLQKRRHSASS